MSPTSGEATRSRHSRRLIFASVTTRCATLKSARRESNPRVRLGRPVPHAVRPQARFLRSKNRASYGGRNRTCELALNRRPPDTNTGNPAISVVVRRTFATNGDSVGVVGFEPTISGTRNRRIPKLSHTPKCSRSASPCAARTSKERLAGIEPALSPWHSDRLPLHHRRSIDVPNCQRSSNKRTTNIELRTEQSTEWDSNPRCRITGAESSPLDHQCKRRMTDC